MAGRKTKILIIIIIVLLIPIAFIAYRLFTHKGPKPGTVLDEARQLQRVRFSASETLECDALFFNLGVEPVCRLHEPLGCKTTKDFLWVDKTQQTSVEGIYAAGDITPNSHLAVVAAAEGAMAAIHIHQSLLPESRRV